MQIVEIETIGRHAADFRPRRFLNNGHLQTIAGNYLARINELPAPEVQLVEVDGLVAGSAAADPALEERLQQQHGLREC